MRRVIIAGNWKMNKTVSESIALALEVRTSLKNVRDREIVICPPFTSLFSVASEIRGSNISLGAQNMHFEKEGAFTGEISPLMLKEAGVKYVILGHSERRHILNESDNMINKKMKSALECGLIPILCVGETNFERESELVEKVITRQIKEGLKGISDLDDTIIAYEPVWAIGTGKTATPKQAQEVHVLIRTIIKDPDIPILYGGSVKPSNINELMVQQDIDGVLVGGASLDAKGFSEIARCQIRKQ